MTLVKVPIKKIYIGDGMPRLPSTYQEVEYIESSGTQYLNLGFTPPSNYLKTEIKVYPTQTGDRRAGGIYDGSNRANVHYIGMSGYIWGGFGGADYSTGVSQAANTLYEIIMEANNGSYSINLNGTTYTGTYSGTVQVSTARPYYLFGNQENGNMGEPFYGRIYYFKATTSEGLIRDMVPCYRKSDSVIGMYDLVNDVFYTNSGSGVFTKGKSILPYKQIRPSDPVTIILDAINNNDTSTLNEITTNSEMMKVLITNTSLTDAFIAKNDLLQQFVSNMWNTITSDSVNFTLVGNGAGDDSWGTQVSWAATANSITFFSGGYYSSSSTYGQMFHRTGALAKQGNKGGRRVGSVNASNVEGVSFVGAYFGQSGDGYVASATYRAN